jgi:hypothetical protein
MRDLQRPYGVPVAGGVVVVSGGFGGLCVREASLAAHAATSSDQAVFQT